MTGPHLFAILGLPPSVSGRVAKHLNKAFSRFGIFHVLAATQQGPIYHATYLDQLVSSLAERISAQATPPSSISIFYVNTTNIDNLILRLYRVAALIPLNKDSTDVTWRFSERNAIASVEAELAKRQQLTVVGRNSAYLLPVSNFFVTKEDSLETTLLAFASGRIDNHEFNKRVKHRCFTRHDLPKVLKGNQKKSFAVDARGLVYPPCASTAEHGSKRYDRSEEVGGAMSYLASVYRLGRLIGNGFHHDVQFSGRDNVAGVTFKCCEKGELVATKGNPHANIYLNDAVRLSTK